MYKIGPRSPNPSGLRGGVEESTRLDTYWYFLNAAAVKSTISFPLIPLAFISEM